jgi:hypothetical protein
MRLRSVDGALAVMNKNVGFIEGVANFSDFMMRVQGLLTG